MSNSTRRKRFHATVAINKSTGSRCRTCRRSIEPSAPIWSPYYGGGFYHLFCQATPTQPPSTTPPESHRCPVCDQWFRLNATHDCCERCLALSWNRFNLSSPSWKRNALRALSKSPSMSP